MPTYIAVARGSDASNVNIFDFVRVLSKDTETTADISYAVPAVTSINVYHFTDQGLPNSDAWEAGATFTAELNVITAQGSLSARYRVSRASSDGSILENGAFTLFQTLTAATVLTFNPVCPTWASAESCGNRLVLQYQIRNVAAATRTTSIRYGDTNSEYTTNITENTSNCRRIFIL